MLSPSNVKWNTDMLWLPHSATFYKEITLTMIPYFLDIYYHTKLQNSTVVLSLLSQAVMFVTTDGRKWKGTKVWLSLVSVLISWGGMSGREHTWWCHNVLFHVLYIKLWQLNHTQPTGSGQFLHHSQRTNPESPPLISLTFYFHFLSIFRIPIPTSPHFP